MKNEASIKENFITKKLTNIAQKNYLKIKVLQQFTEIIINRMIFSGENLNELFAPLDLGWENLSNGNWHL